MTSWSCDELTGIRRKIRAQAWSLFARLFNTQELQYSTSKQFLINYTSTSSSLNFGTIVLNYFLIRPEFIQSGFKCVSRFCMHYVIRQTVPHIDDSISKNKKICADHINQSINQSKRIYIAPYVAGESEAHDSFVV